MSLFNAQVDYVHKLLIFLVEQKKLSFTRAGAALRELFIEQKESNYSTELATQYDHNLSISQFDIEILCEKTRLLLADELAKYNLTTSTILDVVSNYSPVLMEELERIINSKLTDITNALTFWRGFKECSFRNLDNTQINVLNYFILQYGHSAPTAFEIISTLSFHELHHLDWTIATQLPAILEIASSIMNDYNIPFPAALEHMVSVLLTGHSTLVSNFYINQIAAAKLITEDFSALFLGTYSFKQYILNTYNPTLGYPINLPLVVAGQFDSAEHVIKYFHADPNNLPSKLTVSHAFEIEKKALIMLTYLGFNETSAKSLYDKLTIQQIRGLRQALYHGIPCYKSSAEYLLRMLTLDEAHEEIKRVVTLRTKSPRYRIFYEDNNYAEQIINCGLQMWHIELLISDETIRDIYTAKFKLENIYKTMAMKRQLFENVEVKIQAQFRHNQVEYNNQIVTIAQTHLGFDDVSATHLPTQVSEAELSLLPFIATHDFPELFVNLIKHAMHRYGLALDESLNTLWKIATNRFDSNNNVMLHSAVSSAHLEEWYFNLLGYHKRKEIAAAVAAMGPRPSDQPYAFITEIATIYVNLHAAKFQESINKLIETGFSEQAAETLVRQNLSTTQAFRIPYVLQLKLPILKEALKGIITIDESLKSFEDAKAQMEKILRHQFDHIGSRIDYETLTAGFNIQPWHLSLISPKDQVILYNNAAANAERYRLKLQQELTDINRVNINRSHHQWPASNESIFYWAYPKPAETIIRPAAAPTPINISNTPQYNQYSRSSFNPPNFNATQLLSVSLTGIFLLLLVGIRYFNPATKFGIFGACRRRKPPLSNKSDSEIVYKSMQPRSP